jgi:acyl dehydratase
MGMVIPGEDLTVNLNLEHIDMRDGAVFLKVVTTNQGGEEVLEGGIDPHIL